MTYILTLKTILDTIKNKACIIDTDTIPGILTDIDNLQMIKNIYTIKARAYGKPLCVYVQDVDNILGILEISEYCKYIIKNISPIEMTFVCRYSDLNPKYKEHAQYITDPEAGYVGIRAPNNKYIQKIISALGRPIVGTSANISGAGNPKDTQEIYDAFHGKADIFLSHTKQSFSQKGSTIIKIFDDKKFSIIREGFISSYETNKILKTIDPDISLLDR